MLSHSLDIDYSKSEGFKCSIDNHSLTNIVTIANAWIDVLRKVFNKNTKESIYRKISPGELFSYYFSKPSTTNTNNTSSDKQQHQDNSLVCIDPPNEHSNTQLLQTIILIQYPLNLKRSSQSKIISNRNRNTSSDQENNNLNSIPTNKKISNRNQNLKKVHK